MIFRGDDSSLHSIIFFRKKKKKKKKKKQFATITLIEIIEVRYSGEALGG